MLLILTGADSVEYLSVEGLVKAVQHGIGKKRSFKHWTLYCMLNWKISSRFVVVIDLLTSY